MPWVLQIETRTSPHYSDLGGTVSRVLSTLEAGFFRPANTQGRCLVELDLDTAASDTAFTCARGILDYLEICGMQDSATVRVLYEY